ncbi:MAG: hypothetical protein IKV18_06815 [Alistipes sp.]|nr:hypothetical protein [Alistipes sp.]
MKSLKIFFLTALVAVTALFTACTKDQDWSAGEQVPGAQVYFADGVATNVTVEAETSSFEVTVMRGNVDEATTVPLKVAVSAAKVDEEADPINYAELFTVPANVSFGAGKDTAKFTVSFDRASLEDGQTYTLTFSINDAGAVTPYGYDKQTWTLSVPEPYVYIGQGFIREDIIATMFSIDNIEWEVEVYENTNNPGFIYLKNAYTSAFPYNEPGDYVEEDVYFTINISDPDKVVIPTQTLGCDWNPTDYGEFFVGTMEYGTLKNGVITFPVKGLAVGMMIYTEGQFGWYANSKGMFRVVLPGAVLTDYSLDVAYGGFRVAADNATVYPIARAAYGADVAEIQYAFVPGDITADAEALAAALAGIEDGSVKSNKVAVSTSVNAEGEEINEMTFEGVEPVESGVYSVVAIPYGADGAAQYETMACASFYVQGVGAGELPEVEFEMYAMSLEDLAEATGDTEYVDYYISYGYNSSNTVGVIFAGVDIKSLRPVILASDEIEEVIEYYGSIENYVVAYDEYLESNGKDLDYDLEYIEEYGWDYALMGGALDPETNYTMFALVENAFGNAQLFSSSFTTAAEDYLSAKKGGANLRPAVKMDAPLHKQFTSIKPISTISMK